MTNVLHLLDPDNRESIPALSDDLGVQYVQINNSSEISSSNSSIVPVLATLSFTGTWEIVNIYSSISIIGTTDQNSTLYADFSTDGSTVSRHIQLSSGTDANLGIHSLIPVAKYFRTVVTCGAINQASLDVQVIYNKNPRVALPTSRIGQTINNYSDVLNTRSIATGLEPDGSTFSNIRTNGTIYETTSTLGNGGSVDSGILDLANYPQIETNLFASHSGSLVGTWYDDSIGTNIIRTFTKPYSGAEVGSVSYFSSPKFGRYLRYIYTNDTTPQTTFLLKLNLILSSISGQMLGVEDFIPTTVVANLTRSIVAGKTDSGVYKNVTLTNANELLTNTLASNRASRAVYESATISADTYIILVDLSDTTGFPHSETNYLSFDHAQVDVNFAANGSECRILFGVITRIDGTDADITYCIDELFGRASSKDSITSIQNYQPSSVLFRQSGGSAIGVASNKTESAVTSINTGLTLDSPIGSIAPGLGDIIVKYDHISGDFESDINVIYHSD